MDNTSKGIRLLAKWQMSVDGRYLYDLDFTYDAILKVDGDFGSDEERITYTKKLCEKLNKNE